MRFLHRAFGFAVVPRESGGSLPDGDRGARCAAGDADRRGEIAVLSIAGARAGRNDAGDQSADRADGRSVCESCGNAGFAVECIHSGRDRAASRQVCIDYLNGKLQFLFIAPERLRVRGFPGDAGETEAGADCD